MKTATITALEYVDTSRDGNSRYRVVMTYNDNGKLWSQIFYTKQNSGFTDDCRAMEGELVDFETKFNNRTKKCEITAIQRSAK